MSATLDPAILETILANLALLFLTAAGDPEKARHAAIQALAAHDVQTEDELRLASEIISFGFHALEALAQAGAPDLSLSRVLRLRGSAVSLSREAHKSRRRLDQLRRARLALPPQAEPAAALPSQPQPQPQTQPSKAAEPLAQQVIGKNGGMTWTQSYQKRILAKRMAEKAKKVQAQQLAQMNGVASPAPTL